MQESRPTLNLYNLPDVTRYGYMLTFYFIIIISFYQHMKDIKHVRPEYISFAVLLSFCLSLCSEIWLVSKFEMISTHILDRFLLQEDTAQRNKW